MAEEIVEPDLFDGPFDSPVFEAGDMPGQTATPPPQPQFNLPRYKPHLHQPPNRNKTGRIRSTARGVRRGNSQQL